MKTKITLSFSCIALMSQLSATEVTLTPLKITSTAIATDELQSSDAVEVYTQADIKKEHVQNLYEFLNKATSLFATSAYGNPFVQKLDMRGFGVGDGYQNIVVTLNGRRMNNVDMVPQLLASIAPSSIKKIEIIKSSGIVVGGDGANAGVINITTKQSNEKELSFYMGNYDLADSSFYLGHKGKKLSINASGEAQKSDGIRTIDAKGNRDANKFSTGAFNLSYTPNEEIELRLGSMFTRSDVIYAGTMTQQEYKASPFQQGSVDYGFGASPSPATHQTYASDVLSAGATYYANDALSFKVDASHEKKQSNYITYSSVTNYDYDSFVASSEYETKEFSLKAGIDGFDGELKRPKLTLKKTNLAAFVMSEFYLKDITLKAGYRYETINFKQKNGESKDDTLHGVELGANYKLSKTSSLFANYSHSYESATLDRLFNYFTSTYTGYVKPAQANNFNLGYNNITKKNKLKLTAYYVSLKDEIYYYADPSYVNSKNTNIDNSHKYGLDIYEKYLLNKKTALTLNYNYVEAIIDAEKQNGENYAGKKLPGVSTHNIKASLSYLPNEKTTLSLTQVYRSDAYAANDFNNNFSQKQDPFSTTDIAATYTTKSWELFAKVNNIFGETNGLWIRDNAIYPVSYATTALAGFKLKY